MGKGLTYANGDKYIGEPKDDKKHDKVYMLMAINT